MILYIFSHSMILCPSSPAVALMMLFWLPDLYVLVGNVRKKEAPSLVSVLISPSSDCVFILPTKRMATLPNAHAIRLQYVCMFHMQEQAQPLLLIEPGLVWEKGKKKNKQ